MSKKTIAYIERAYQIINGHTPLEADCGQLCGAACCKGDENLGMLLFPGEEVLLFNSKSAGFCVSEIDYMDSKAWFLSCKGQCNRELRPLACRIFPLAPVFAPDGKISIINDPRARSICPLYGSEYISADFYSAVSRAIRLLSHDKHCLAFLSLLSAELKELDRFTANIIHK